MTLKLGSKSKIINGNNYETVFMPAMFNMSLFLKVSSILGSALPELFGALNKGSDLSLIGKAINNVLVSLHINDPKGMVILEILGTTKRNNVEVNAVTFDEFYTGNMSEMVEALMFSLEVHFKDFLPLKKLSGLLSTKELTAGHSAENLTTN